MKTRKGKLGKKTKERKLRKENWERKPGERELGKENRERKSRKGILGKENWGMKPSKRELGIGKPERKTEERMVTRKTGKGNRKGKMGKEKRMKNLCLITKLFGHLSNLLLLNKLVSEKLYIKLFTYSVQSIIYMSGCSKNIVRFSYKLFKFSSQIVLTINS